MSIFVKRELFLLAFLLAYATFAVPACAATRVMLLIDNSRSMCENPPEGNCCVEGDGSGFCAQNDSADMRILASHHYIDNLRARQPESEVGLISYSQTLMQVFAPLSLTVDSNVQKIHNAVDKDRCSTMRRVTSLPKTIRTKDTYLGLALERALTEIDRNFDNIPPGMKRQVIILTDGSWDDLVLRSPDTILTDYTAHFPTREFPVVHGIFITDSVMHVQHGYPPNGCSTSGGGVVEVSHLLRIVSATGGTFFGGATPHTVVDNLLSLLPTVAVDRRADMDRLHQRPTDAINASSRYSPAMNLLGRQLENGGRGKTFSCDAAHGIYLNGNNNKNGKLQNTAAE